MNSQTKLALKRWAVRQMRKLIWRADEWIHAQEIKLRLEAERAAATAGVVTRRAQDEAQSVRLPKPGKTFELWQADRLRDRSNNQRGLQKRTALASGERKKRLTAAQFDQNLKLRFSR